MDNIILFLRPAFILIIVRLRHTAHSCKPSLEPISWIGRTFEAKPPIGKVSAGLLEAVSERLAFCHRQVLREPSTVEQGVDHVIRKARCHADHKETAQNRAT